MKKILTFLLSALCLLTLIPISAEASGQMADDKVLCELTLQYCDENKAFSELEVQIFRAAEVTEDGAYIETERFSRYQLDINEITGQAEWDKAAATLSAYIFADKLEADYTEKTDTDGNVIFSSLPMGLYFVQSAKAATETETIEFSPFWIILLGQNENGEPSFDVTAKPKHSTHELTYSETEYKVVKHWKDSGDSNTRPDSISIEIQKDGVTVSTELLSAENDWSYCWKARDDGSIWNAVERNIPKGYKVLVEEKENTIIITNISNEERCDPPKTGDSMAMYPAIIILCISGAVMLIFGIRIKRKNNA